MKKALVTGANGFIGSKLTRTLLDNGVEVIAAARGNSRIPEGARFVRFDMSDFGALGEALPDNDIDVMFHLAWAGASGAARGDYALQLDNVRYTCDAVKFAAEAGIKRFVGAGTLAQYDCSAYVGKNGSQPNAVSCYGSAKTAAQYMSKAVANSLGTEHIWCVISNTYGEGDTTTNFVNFALKKMLSGERAAFTSGEQNYDFVYVTDTANGLYLCGENGKANKSYYLGSSEARQLKEYINIMHKAAAPDAPLYLGEIPFKGISLPIEQYDCGDTFADTGYKAGISFEEGTERTLRWIKEQEI